MEAFRQRGIRVGVLKPIETGVVTAPPDGTLLLQTLQACNPLTESFTVRDVVPLQMALPAAPFVAGGGRPIDWARIDAALAKMESVCDLCLIEGAGGLLVPLDASHDIIDMVSHFDAKALLVSHCRLGGINDTRLSLEALEQRGLAAEWVLNYRGGDAAFEQTSRPYYDARYPVWYRLDRDLDALCDALLL